MIRRPAISLAALTLAAGATLLGLTTQEASAAGDTFNGGGLSINDFTIRSSTIAVSGQPFSLSDVNVSITGLSHTQTEDLDILVEGPTGVKVMLVSDAGGANGIANGTLGFDDAATSFAPNSTAISPGTYKPTNHVGADEPDAQLPAFTATTLAAFIGTNPNGTWRLWVSDYGATNEGSIGGWSLNLNPEKATCAGTPATIVDTNNADPVILGTPGDDVIVGSAGDDVIKGFGGNDLICGGAGRDKLKGGAGKDTCYGGPAKDKIKCEKAKQNGG